MRAEYTHQGTEQRVSRIIIDVEATDDPHHMINGLMTPGRDRLAHWLMVYANPEGVHTLTDDEAWEALTGAGFVSQVTTTRMEETLLHIRDQRGWSWRKIASAMDRDHQWVRRLVTRRRTEAAHSGVWIDSEGTHRPEVSADPGTGLLGAPSAPSVRIARALAAYRESTPHTGRVTFTVPETGPHILATWVAEGAEDTPSAVELIPMPEPRTITLTGGPLDGTTTEVRPEDTHLRAVVDGHRLGTYRADTEHPHLWHYEETR